MSLQPFNPQAYGTTLLPLLEGAAPAPLDEGQPTRAMGRTLVGLDSDAIFTQVRDRQMAKCCLSGLWLLHNYLDESHSLSQDIHTVEGSYWHGIMHRREPDFPNAKYWFRRVEDHPIFNDLQSEAARLATESPHPDAAFLIEQKDWDACAFVDLCEKAYRGSSSCEPLCRAIQHREWELLFDFCYHQAKE